MNYRILLYYKYTTIEDPELYAKRHLNFCKALDVKGRILIAAEGINGTLSGEVEQTDAYINALKSDSRFEGIQFKIDEADAHAFKKLFVRYRSEIVTLGLTDDDINPNVITGKHLSPKEFLRTMEEEDVVIIDGRNDYEYELGHFENAIRPDVKSFKEFPQWIRENVSEYKDKKILTYCTGGIRCEKLSGLLLREGFKDVSQLLGGIINYGKDPDVKGKKFRGKCYVFDERISVPVNTAEEYKPVSKCRYCNQASDRYINCSNLECNLQFFCCEKCSSAHSSLCPSCA